MEPESWVVALAREWGWAATGAVFAVYLVVNRLDLFKRIFVDRHKLENDEREQLSEDTQHLIANLRSDADWQRKTRIEESDRDAQIIAGMRTQIIDRDGTIARLTESITLSERGNSRLRHALNDALQWGAAIRVRALEADVVIDSFPLDNLMAHDPELAERLRGIFDDGNRLVAARRGTPGH